MSMNMFEAIVQAAAHLKKTDGHIEDGAFVADQASQVDVMSELSTQALEPQQKRAFKHNGVSIHIPINIAKDHIGRNIPSCRVLPEGPEDKGNPRVVVTLPSGTKAMLNGKEVDLSFHGFWTRENWIVEDRHNKGFLLVFMPECNAKTNEAWIVTCTQDVMEQQDGKWVKDKALSTEYRIPSAELSRATAERCRELREQSRQHRQQQKPMSVSDKIEAAKVAQAANQGDKSTPDPAKSQTR